MWSMAASNRCDAAGRSKVAAGGSHESRVTMHIKYLVSFTVLFNTFWTYVFFVLSSHTQLIVWTYDVIVDVDPIFPFRHFFFLLFFFSRNLCVTVWRTQNAPHARRHQHRHFVELITKISPFFILGATSSLQSPIAWFFLSFIHSLIHWNVESLLSIAETAFSILSNSKLRNLFCLGWIHFI